jgi:hypothetical protein
MFRRVKRRDTSKRKGMVSMVQEMITDISENDTRVCIWYAEHIISSTGYRERHSSI